jgi:hypothetical protein
LLVELSRCAWESLKAFLQARVPEPKAVPAAVVSTHISCPLSLLRT